jgi:hypothetical protein
MLISNRARKQARAAVAMRAVSSLESDRNSPSARLTPSTLSLLTNPAPAAMTSRQILTLSVISTGRPAASASATPTPKFS